jgi:ribosomal protein S11
LACAITGTKKVEEPKTITAHSTMEESKPVEKLVKEVYFKGKVERKVSDNGRGRGRGLAASIRTVVKAGFKF